MWLTLIMAIASFFLAGGADKEKRGKAALVALGVGAATYGVTNHTEWGRENLGWLDGVEVTTDGDGNKTVVSGPTDPGTPLPKPTSGGAGTSSTSGSNSFWTTLTGWLTSPVGQVSTGAGVASLSGVPSWLVWGGVGLGAYLILKD